MKQKMEDGKHDNEGGVMLIPEVGVIATRAKTMDDQLARSKPVMALIPWKLGYTFILGRPNGWFGQHPFAFQSGSIYQ